jgi:large subunit ribosomal protein L17
MNHGNKQNNLSRTASHRKALLMNLGCQLITYKRITTTLLKQKHFVLILSRLLLKQKLQKVKKLFLTITGMCSAT